MRRFNANEPLPSSSFRTRVGGIPPENRNRAGSSGQRNEADLRLQSISDEIVASNNDFGSNHTLYQRQRQRFEELHRELEEARDRNRVLQAQSITRQRREGGDSRAQGAVRAVIEGYRNPSTSAETDRQIEELLQRDPSQGPLILEALLQRNLELLSILHQQEEQPEYTIGSREVYSGSRLTPSSLEEHLSRKRTVAGLLTQSWNGPNMADLLELAVSHVGQPATDGAPQSVLRDQLSARSPTLRELLETTTPSGTHQHGPTSGRGRDLAELMQMLRNTSHQGLGGCSDGLPNLGTVGVDLEPVLDRPNQLRGGVDRWVSGFREPVFADQIKNAQREGASSLAFARFRERAELRLRQLGQLESRSFDSRQDTSVLQQHEQPGTVNAAVKPVNVGVGYARATMASALSTRGLFFPLSAETDELYLAPFQIEVRKCIEFFAADDDDVNTTVQGRKKKIRLGQVGIRCSYCRHLPIRARKNGAVYYPNALRTVYQSASNITRTHLIDNCQMVPKEIVESIKGPRAKQEESLIGKNYWIQSCAQKGIVERDGALWMEG